MARVKIKAVPKMQLGGYPAITDIDRQAYNNYIHGMRKLPGYDAVNWQHDQTFQKNAAQQLGFDYSKAAAIQADMMTRNEMYPGSIKGIQGSDPWGGKPGWVGDRERQKEYKKNEYLQYDKSGNLIGHIKPTFTPLTPQQYNSWTDQNRARAYQPDLPPTTNPMDPAYVAPSAPQAAPRATGLAATGFPTREEAIAKYKARKASGQELPSNYFLEDTKKQKRMKETGDPIGMVRSTGEDVYAYGGNVTKRVRITSVPTMAEGGYANTGASRGYGNQQAGQGYALNRFWNSPAGYPGSTSQVNPYGKVGNTLPEAKDGGDINAEKQEMVLGDFDQDGQQELMNVDGPPHTQGGKDVNVPSNSFVFSDTKDLKIKDPQILAMFGMAPKRGGYTPAFIAKKYDLNKLKKILDDPNADDMSKKTAQLMNDNYLAKLNKLAQVQEGMKGAMGMEHHDPERGQVPAQEPPVQIVGNMDQGGAEMMQPEVMAKYGGIPYMAEGGDPDEQSVYNMYPNTLTSQGYVYERPTPENVRSFIQQSIQPRPSGYKPGNLTAEQYDAMRRAGWDGKSNPGEWAQKNQYDQVQAAIKESGLSNPAADASSKNQLGYTYRGPRWEAFKPKGPDYNPTMQDATRSQSFYIQPHQLNLLDPSDQTVGPKAVTVPPMGPFVATDTELPLTEDNKKRKTKTKEAKQRRGIFMNPNLYGDAMNIAQMLQLQKFVPYAPVPQAVIPDTVFVDPTRAIAAQQEMARNAMEMAGQSANARAARATGLAYQGEAGKQAADTIAQYAAQNVGIANAANANAAQITNQLMQMEANRMEELNKGNFLAARDYQREMGRLQAEWADRKQKQHDTAVKTAWINKTSPYFNVDPYTQMPVFKPGNAEAEYWKAMNGAPDTSLAERFAQLKALHGETAALRLLELERGQSTLRHKNPITGDIETTKGKTETGKYGGMMRYGGSHMAMPQMAPYYQIGGVALTLPNVTEESFVPQIDNTAYMMPAQNPQPLQVTSEENPVEGMSSKKANKRDIATITNNPGNIIYTPKFAKLFGAVDSGIKQRDGKGHFAMFPDLNTGFTAYQTQLFGDVDGVMKSNYYKKDTTVDQALKTWSNKGYDGSIYPEIKHKKLGELTLAERNELAKRQIKHESGDMYRLLRQRGVFKYGGSPLQKFIR